MTRALRLTARNGEVWEIDTEPIAAARAHYYADRHGLRGAEREAFVDDEIAGALVHSGLVVEWARNNMDPGDLLAHARRVREPARPSFAELWYDPETTFKTVE